ncbi:GHMP kinase [Microseira wollei NIES-4236]|uniref:UTP--glucose-1-phosphate uridylyltransferase n=2 Tax=Microseira wollei TaxID=467598 RepID=A0AAV3X4C0_9CYAN|nr:GHMP kinase [Microseira wollei NIES-4236]
MNIMKIFVPGRLCLFGEHSDWAGGYRRINPNLEKGYALLVGTNQGLYAEVQPHPTHLILRASLSDGTHQTISLPMSRQVLLAEAEKGGFFSYAAGVAYQFLTHYRVGGIEIDNYLTDLPIQKGLSSSAAICVLIARAFNRVYDLKMTVRGEMEFAYLGEITTFSRCGRMDQACAYGSRPILMIFDGDRIDVIELNVPKDLFFVIVDLGAGKNTQEILSNLNQCYPFPTNKLQQNVQKYLGSISAQITQAAVNALQKGDGQQIGALMKKAQAEFDQYLIPASPSQLTSPVLHKLLNYQPIQPDILGGKGVGSQGDGTAQFIVKDESSQQKVIEIIERDFPQMQCLKLAIKSSLNSENLPVVAGGQDAHPTREHPTREIEKYPLTINLGGQDAHPTREAEKYPLKRKVRKGVIPAAGFGTRLFPATKAVKKELFPIIDREGRAKPVILSIVEELISGGIEEIGIVVQTCDRALFEEFFKSPPSPEFFNKLSPQNQEYSQYLQDLGNRVTILTQEVQSGYGHAVFCAKDWVNNEPFLLSLGDHVYSSDTDISCAGQVINIYEKVNQNVVGLTTMPAEIIQKAGCVTGVWQELNSIISLTQVAEKPTVEYARQHLRVEGMAEDEFLCIFGLYVLTPTIFDCLSEDIKNNIRFKGEFQLTTCLEKLRQKEGMTGYVVKGKCFDTGMPDVYRQAMIDFRNS